LSIKNRGDWLIRDVQKVRLLTRFELPWIESLLILELETCRLRAGFAGFDTATAHSVIHSL
jgi:hypothetical protein